MSLSSVSPDAQPRLDLRIIAISQPTTRLFPASMAMLRPSKLLADNLHTAVVWLPA